MDVRSSWTTLSARWRSTPLKIASIAELLPVRPVAKPVLEPAVDKVVQELADVRKRVWHGVNPHRRQRLQPLVEGYQSHANPRRSYRF
jgi:hypothetical protein